MVHNFKEMDCSVCGQYHFSYDSESFKNEPDYAGVVNDLSLNEYRKQYLKKALNKHQCSF